jgi:hypothetical protein
MASQLMCQNDLDFLKALDNDEINLKQLLSNMLNSDNDREAVLELKGDDAECFLTLTFHVCILDILYVTWAYQ